MTASQMVGRALGGCSRADVGEISSPVDHDVASAHDRTWMSDGEAELGMVPLVWAGWETHECDGWA